uniref:Polyprotein n=1 Tax=Gymnadenia betaflexivirus 1 TaxID=2794403 RepID=A0A7T5UFA7_9VIRU|nr:polyprotein [Gymnadenia betaflexivirus 1]
MSITYKTPSEYFCNQLSQKHTECISIVNIDRLASVEARLSPFFSFNLSKKKKKILTDWGIYLSPFSWMPHSHAACKTIENELLFNSIYNFVHNNPSSTFVLMSLRDSKFQTFKGLFPKPKKKDLNTPNDPVLDLLCNFNRCITVKDSFRYGIDRKTQMRDCLKLEPEKKKKKKKLHNSCEIHYWNPEDLDNFIVENEPNSIVATLVHPSEVELGFSKSMLPEIYDFTIRGDSLFFYPDGNKSECYEQPRTAGWWLHCKQFNTKIGSYGVSILRSLGPFHLVIIKKNSVISESRRFFADFSCVSFSRSIKMRGSDFSETRLRGEVFRKIVRYVLSLKKPDKESVMAKLRMMDDDSKDLDESLLCAKLTQSLLKDKVLENFDVSLVDWLFCGLKECFPETFQIVFLSDFFKKKNNLDTLMNLKELEVEIETFNMNKNYNHASLIFMVFSKIKDSLQSEKETKDIEMFGIVSKNKNLAYPDRSTLLYGSEGGYNSGLTYSNDEFMGFTNLVIKFEGLEYCVDTQIDYAKRSIEDEKTRKELIRNMFWSDEKRVTGAMDLSKKKKGSKLSDNYRCFIPSDSYSLYKTNGYEVVLIPIKWLNNAGKFVDFWLFVQLNFALYPVNRAIKNEAEGWVEEPKKDSEDIEAMFEWLKKKKKEETKEFNHIENVLSLPRSMVICQNHLPNDLNISNFKNACCFKSLMEANDWSQDELISNLPDGDFIRKLIEDKGLFSEEFYDLLEKMEINYICKNRKMEILKKKNFKGKKKEIMIFELSDDHCTFVGKIEEEELTEVSRHINKEMCGGCILNNDEDLNSEGRVEKLIECFTKGHTGVIVKEKIEDCRKKKKVGVHCWRRLPNKKILNELINYAHKNNTFVGIFGVAGSGKSSKLIKEINEGSLSSKRVLYVSPRKLLMDEIKLKFDQNKNVDCLTFEKALTSGSLDVYEIFVIDEVSLYPPGFTDLFLLTASVNVSEGLQSGQIKKENLVVNRVFFYVGDFAQVRYHGDSDSVRLDKLDEIDYVVKKAKKEITYYNYSFRIPRNSRFSYGHENLGEEIEARESRFFINCQVAKLALPDSNVLVASMEEMLKFKNFEAKTFGMVQGLTIGDALICLSPATLSCSNEAIYVAFSRCKGNIDFFFNGYSDKNEFLERCRGSCLQGLLTIGRFDFIKIAIKNLERISKKKVIIEERKGLSQEDIELKLQGDPYLKSIIPFYEPIINYVEPCREPACDMANPKIHLPIWEKNNYCAEVTTRMKNRELREFKTEKAMSEQFPDFFKKGEPQSLLPNPCRFQGIYPKHSNSDSLTFFAAVKKRLKFSCPAKEREKFENVLHLGEEMFHVFLEKVPLDPKINRIFLEESEMEYVQKKVSKSGATIQSHVARSDPDWGKHEIFLFIKTQLCTKYEKRFCDAKAGQTLACFAHKLLNRFAAPCRYLEKKIQEALPERFYIHQKKRFYQLNDWVIKFGFDDVCTESDYEAFDSSQDALILAMEYAMLKYIQWDKSLIEDYLDMKFNLGCRLGNLAVMRFTGEFGTFILNTVCNMSFTFMTYNIKENVAIAFAGDDMCANSALKEYGAEGPYEHILKKLTLKAKVDRTKNPTFCGWRLTRKGLYKRPELILDRLLISEEKGTFHETLDGYLMEFSYAYKLGEWLFESFSEKEFQAHYICTRLFVKNRHKISKSLHVFVDQIRDKDVRLGSCQLLKSMNSLKHTTQEKKELIVYTQTVSTQIQVSPQENFLTLFRGMSVPYRSNVPSQAEISSRECQSFIGTQLNWKKEKESLNGLIWVQFQFPSTNLVIMTQSPRQEQYLLSMAEKGEENVLSKHMILTSPRNQHISFLPQTQISICMMSCLLEHVRSMFPSMTTYMLKALVHLGLKLELYFVCQMHSIVCTGLERLKMGNSGEATRPFLTRLDGTQKNTKMPMECTTKRYSNQDCFLQNQLESRKLLKVKGEINCLFAKNKEVRANISITSLKEINSKKLARVAARLGQVKKVLMNLEFLVNYWTTRLAPHFQMALEGQQGQNQARTVRDWVYLKGDCMDPPSISLLKYRRRMLLRNHFVAVLRGQMPGMPIDPNTWNAKQAEVWDKVCHFFAVNVFGNLAVYGFSEVTVYPPIDIPIMIEYGDPVVPVVINTKLTDIKHQFKYYADHSGVDILTGLTWRQIGECFAEDIREYLRDVQPTSKTWLASSNPALARGAPWVAIDVTRGLYKPLSPQEELVVARANNHLLKTQKLRSGQEQSAETYLES